MSGEREREREREKDEERDRERVDGCGFPALGWERGAEFLNWGHLPMPEFRNLAGPGRAGPIVITPRGHTCPGSLNVTPSQL